jgi:PTH1 family peptidyl-tRNA hydrolase
MKVVVGLGNPGRKYEGTRHNVGFQLVAELARRHGARSPKTKFEAEIAEIQLGSERVLLVAPQTFMNASGRSVRPLADFYQLELSNLLVVCDDIALPLGRIRVRKSGSSGGQKGLENILQQLGTQEVARLRIGVDAPPPQMDAADYVLSKFGKREVEDVDAALMRAADAVEAWVIDGLVAAMNRFNPPGPDTATGAG